MTACCLLQVRLRPSVDRAAAHDPLPELPRAAGGVCAPPHVAGERPTLRQPAVGPQPAGPARRGARAGGGALAGAPAARHPPRLPRGRARQRAAAHARARRRRPGRAPRVQLRVRQPRVLREPAQHGPRHDGPHPRSRRQVQGKHTLPSPGTQQMTFLCFTSGFFLFRKIPE